MTSTNIDGGGIVHFSGTHRVLPTVLGMLAYIETAEVKGIFLE